MFTTGLDSSRLTGVVFSTAGVGVLAGVVTSSLRIAVLAELTSVAGLAVAVVLTDSLVRLTSTAEAGMFSTTRFSKEVLSRASVAGRLTGNSCSSASAEDDRPSAKIAALRPIVACNFLFMFINSSSIYHDYNRGDYKSQKIKNI